MQADSLGKLSSSVAFQVKNSWYRRDLRLNPEKCFSSMSTDVILDAASLQCHPC